MKTRIMILPYGNVLLGKKQRIGFDEDLGYHLYWIRHDGDKYVSIKGKTSVKQLMAIAKKWNWTIDELGDE